jgi:hypothetical protein
MFVFEQNRLTEQIAHGDPEGACELVEHVETANVTLVPLDLTQPVFGPSHNCARTRWVSCRRRR